VTNQYPNNPTVFPIMIRYSDTNTCEVVNDSSEIESGRPFRVIQTSRIDTKPRITYGVE
jgi:hypothetical protein